MQTLRYRERINKIVEIRAETTKIDYENWGENFRAKYSGKRNKEGIATVGYSGIALSQEDSEAFNVSYPHLTQCRIYGPDPAGKRIMIVPVREDDPAAQASFKFNNGVYSLGLKSITERLKIPKGKPQKWYVQFLPGPKILLIRP